jgi:hypothetical protein
VKSATHIRFGASGLKLRLTKSTSRAAPWTGMVYGHARGCVDLARTRSSSFRSGLAQRDGSTGAASCQSWVIRRRYRATTESRLTPGDLVPTPGSAGTFASPRIRGYVRRPWPGNGSATHRRRRERRDVCVAHRPRGVDAAAHRLNASNRPASSGSLSAAPRGIG